MLRSSPPFAGGSVAASSSRARTRGAALLASALLTFAVPTHAEGVSASLAEEYKFLDEEFEVVFAPFKRRQPLERTAAAVRVYTAEDIRASGARNLGELLRDLPSVGLTVNTPGETSIGGARGVSGESVGLPFVEILIDGRSVRQEWFGTVFYSPLPLVLADVERIEVLQGSNGAIYGPGGLNLVIDIHTRDPRDARGAVLQVAGGGPTAYADASAIVGVTLGAIRTKLAGEITRIDEFGGAESVLPDDDSTSVATGRLTMRNALDLGDDGRYEVSGSFTFGDFDFVFPSVFDGENSSERSATLAHERRAGPGQLSIQTSWTEFTMGITAGELDDAYRTTADRVDAEARWQLDGFADHRALVGVAYRYETARGDLVSPTSDVASLGVVVSDEWRLTDRLSVNASGRIETLDRAGTELLPGAGVAWEPVRGHTLWAGVGRGLLAPALFARQGRFPFGSLFPDKPGGGLPGLLHDLLPTFVGNDDLDYQDLWSYELGYRSTLADRRVHLDLVVYSEDARDLLGLGPLTKPPHATLTFANRFSFRTAGTEVRVTVQPQPWLTLTGSYVWVHPFDEQDALGEFVPSETIAEHRGSISLTFDAHRAEDVAPWLRGLHGQVQFSTTSEFRLFAFGSLIPGGDLSEGATWSGPDLLSARLGYELSPAGAEIAVEGWNLLDAELPIWGHGNQLVVGRVTVPF